jgi:purine-binding chemotaxis protein CheW
LRNDSQCALLVFEVSDRVAALTLEDVARIVPMAQLARPPGLPSALEGVLNLNGAAVSVLRLDRLLGLPSRDPGLYSMVIVLRKEVLLKGTGCATAVLADRVRETLSVPEAALLPVSEDDSFNACARAAVSVAGQYIHVLSPQRLLLEQEARALSEFHAMAQLRLQQWEAGPQ